MARPQQPRKIRNCQPKYTAFKPAGVPSRNLASITMTLDELEAICLSDKDGLYQEEAAEKMEISRQVFANILKSAHKKITELLLEGKVLVIEGGSVCCCSDSPHHKECCTHHHEAE